MKALVTGGGGFLGSAIVRQLLARGIEVRSYSRTPAKLEIPQFHGDLRDTDKLAEAMTGCEVVFHVAAKAGIWGKYQDFYATNTQGTLSVLAACRQAGVAKLVHTSTPSVVHGGGSLEGVNESAPYPAHFEAPYPATKALAEQAVLQANDATLSTVALRPHLIWGPGDPHLVPRIVARAKDGKLKRIGTHPVMVDVTYVDNAAAAHLVACDSLNPNAPCAGRAYFITNGEPVELWDFLNRILAIHNVPPVTRSVAVWKAKLAGQVCEWLWQFLPGEPPMTRFVASQLSTSHYYDITAARRDLGYHPTITLTEGLDRLRAGM
ncbi:MAG: NAD-dependent epimerase/dehydratase family protein [Fimbriiglobus sp.]